VVTPLLTMGTLPLQFPELLLAVHEVAALLVQARVEAWLTSMVDGVAVKVATVAGGVATALTLMATEVAGPVPPGPLQVSVYV
jgi:hypothetical protein